ncbi:MAG: hypothetical protein MUF22_09585, partial [Chitinispirillaceae bacterium]|nr:hypothetical protein [Chitinispirillaceae bacterium]
GGDGFIGRSTGISLNHYPGFLAKFRFVDENFFLPAMSLGFDYQGYGGIATEEQFGYTGYIYKSEGFFFVVSKSYLLFRKIELGFHWDIHMSTEEWSENKALNMITGADLGISDHVSFLFEYNLGLNTKDPYGGANSAVRPLDGYLHAGLRWNFNPNFIVEFNGRDLLENRKRGTVDPGQKVGWSRELKLIYRSDI